MLLETTLENSRLQEVLLPSLGVMGIWVSGKWSGEALPGISPSVSVTVSSHSDIPCNIEKGLGKLKYFPWSTPCQYNLFSWNTFYLTMHFKCSPPKPQILRIPLMQNVCRVTSEPDASRVSSWCYFGVQINTLVYVTVTTVPFLNSKYKPDTALDKIWSFAQTGTL